MRPAKWKYLSFFNFCLTAPFHHSIFRFAATLSSTQGDSGFGGCRNGPCRLDGGPTAPKNSTCFPFFASPSRRAWLKNPRVPEASRKLMSQSPFLSPLADFEKRGGLRSGLPSRPAGKVLPAILENC